jgi:hypothetical protein
MQEQAAQTGNGIGIAPAIPFFIAAAAVLRTTFCRHC